MEGPAGCAPPPAAGAETGVGPKRLTPGPPAQPLRVPIHPSPQLNPLSSSVSHPPLPEASQCCSRASNTDPPSSALSPPPGGPPELLRHILSDSAPCSTAPGPSPKHAITLAEHLLCAGPGETLGCSQRQDRQLCARKLAASLRDSHGRENFMARLGPVVSRTAGGAAEEEEGLGQALGGARPGSVSCAILLSKGTRPLEGGTGTGHGEAQPSTGSRQKT